MECRPPFCDLRFPEQSYIRPEDSESQGAEGPAFPKIFLPGESIFKKVRLRILRDGPSGCSEIIGTIREGLQECVKQAVFHYPNQIIHLGLSKFGYEQLIDY